MKLYKDRYFLFLTLLAALLLRLDLLIANNFAIDADEAIVGLMAKHISEGADWPVFYYGQNYMGSLEAILVSFVFKMFGISNLALKSVPLIFSLLLIPVVYLLSLEVAGRFAARTAALLCALPSSALVVWSSMARGGFIEIVFIGAVALLLTCRWLKHEDPGLTLSFVIGLILGLGWWVNNQVIFFMLPIALFMFAHLFRNSSFSLIFAHFLLGNIGFFLGGLPFWSFNLEHSFVSFNMFKLAGDRNIPKQFTDLFTTAFPILLGAKRFWQKSDLFVNATRVVYVLYAGVIVLFAAMRTKQIYKLTSLRIDARKPVEIFFVFIMACACIFALSTFGHLAEAPRYLLPTYIGIFVLVGFVLEQLYKLNTGIACLLLGLMLGINFYSSYPGQRQLPGEPFVMEPDRVAKDHTQLLTWLNDNNFTWIRTNYWIGYRLAFESREKVRFSIFQAPEQVRIPEYEKQARELGLENLPLVLVPTQAEIAKQAYASMGLLYQQVALGDYVVFYNLHNAYTQRSEIQLQGAQALASHQAESAPKAIDADLSTRWGSAHPQEPGMWFELEFPSERKLGGISLELGQWYHDYPRGLQIEVENAQGGRTIVLNPKQYFAISYMQGQGGVLPIFFDEINGRKLRLIETGTHPILDWSIAEMKVFD